MPAYDVLATLEKLGIEGRAYRREFSAHCPMHFERTGKEDSSPSWSINIDTGLFICYSCKYRGTLLTLISDVTGVTIDEARTRGVKIDLDTSIKRMQGTTKVKLTRDRVYPESILGRFTDPPRWARNKRGLTLEACQFYGVYWDPVEDEWIMPIRTPSGDLIGWQAKGQLSRSFRNFPLGVKKSHCLSGYDVFDGGQMIVVEAPLDPARMYSLGVTGGVSTFGSEISSSQINLMTAADEVVFALDNPYIDSAGKSALKRMYRETKGVLKSVRFFHYEEDGSKDPGEMQRAELTRGITMAKSRAYGPDALGIR